MAEVETISEKCEESPKEETWGKKFKVFTTALKTVSVEPSGFLLMTSTLTSYLIFQNLMIENICRVRLNLTEEVCREIVNVNATYAKEEAEIQKVFAETKIFRSIIDHGIPLLYVIFMGPLSDHYGRKLPLVLAMGGAGTQKLLYLIMSFYRDSVDPHLLNVLCAFPGALTGGLVAYQMGAYSFIADTTSHSQRTFRTGLMSACYLGGVPSGFALGGLLVRKGLGYPESFGIALGLCVLGIVIILFRVKDRRIDCLEAGENETKGLKKIWEVMNPRNNFVKVLTLPLKKREDNGRVKFFLLLITFFCSAAPIHGEFGVFYLFLRNRLGWNASDYGDFSTYNAVIGVVGVALSMGIFSKWMKLADPVVGFIAGMSQMAGCVVYALAYSSFMMYLAPTVDMMNGTMHVIAKSMMSKIVFPSEVGKLFSLVAIIESLTPLGMDPLYSTLYRFTIDTFSGSFFILSAALTVPPQLIYFWFIIKSKSGKGQLKVPPIEEEKEEGGVTNQGFVAQES